MAATELVRYRAVVAGRVQGVGFRYFVRSTALELRLSGWVMNRPDGGVELEAQGPAAAFAAFREAVRTGPRLAGVEGYVEEPLPVMAGEKGFVIRH